MDRLITLLDTFSLEKQMEMLENNIALGDARHRRKVKNLLLQLKDALSQAIFCYAAQRNLRWPELARLLHHLETQIKPQERQFTKGDATLVATVLYTVEDELCPPHTNGEFGASLRRYLRDNHEAGWQCMELYDVIRLRFLVSVSKLTSSAPHSVPPAPPLIRGRAHSPGARGDSDGLGYRLQTPRHAPANPTEVNLLVHQILGHETCDMEFPRNLFGFLQHYIFAYPSYYTWDPDICRIYHGFFTEFIIHMPLKLKEMKYRSEEVAKTILMCQESGVIAPVPDVAEFESFLECLGEFYEHDPFELGRYYFMENSMFLPCTKLVRTCCQESPSMFTSCMRFLNGVATGDVRGMFDLLRQSGHNASLDHFFESIALYLQNFGMQLSLEADRYQQQQHHHHHQPQTPAQMIQATSMIMNPMEIRSICSYLRLIETVCTRSEAARTYFTAQKSHWIRTALQVVKIRKFPREVRAAVLETCAAMIGEDTLSPEITNTLWDIFYSTKLLDPGTGDVKEELEEKETRLEEYCLTVGMLRLLRALVQSRFRKLDFVSNEGYFVHPTFDNGGIFPYINYVTDTVFLKMPYRLFKESNQRWYVMKLCAEIISLMLDYLPKLMIQLLCDSPLIKTLLNTLVDCSLATDLSSSDSENPVRDEVDRCSLSLLQLLWRALQRQQFYLTQKKEVMESNLCHDSMLMVGIHKVMMSTATENGAPDYILSVIRFVDNLFSGPQHVRAALEILTLILEDHTDIDCAVHHALVWHEGIAGVFRHTLVELLFQNAALAGSEAELCQLEDLKIAALKLIRTSAVHADPNVGLFLLNFDVKKRDYQGDRTVLSALLNNAAGTPHGFLTLQTLMMDPRLNAATLQELKRTRFFQGYLTEHGMIEQLSFEGMSYFLKCLAIELKSEDGLGQVAQDLVGPTFGRLEEVLNSIQLENLPGDLPDFEFFDRDSILKALKQCEYIDPELKTRLIRVERLDGMLKDEITKLEKSAVLRLRKTVHGEAKEILDFARHLNTSRVKEGCKLLVFDGWRQVVEVLALTPQLQQTGFCPSVLRMLLSKVVSGQGHLTEYFLKMAAETTLVLTAVMAGGKEGPSCSGTALSVVIRQLCQWLQSAQNPNVRGLLYASLLYCVNMLSSGTTETLLACQGAFPKILHNLCKDCCQGASENTRMQALYLMGEIIGCTTQRGMNKGAPLSRRELEAEEGSRGQRDQSQIERRMESVLDTTVDSACSFEGSFVDGVLDKPGLNSTNIFGGASGEPGNLADSASSLGWLMRPPRAAGGVGELTAGIKRMSEGDQDKSGLKGVARTTSVQETIMSCVYTNGFLSTLVESLCVVDDMDLIALLTSHHQHQQLQQAYGLEEDVSNLMAMAMRAFFVFEAKMTMLTRLAGVGLKSVMCLLDLSLLKRLTDMKVFELQSYHQQREDEPAEPRQRQSRRGDGGSMGRTPTRGAATENWNPDMGSPMFSSTPQTQRVQNAQREEASGSEGQSGVGRSEEQGGFTPGNQSISESLYMQVFKLFHVMLDSAPRNVQVIEQIFQFIRVHDQALCKLLNLTRITKKGNSRNSVLMLTALMEKLARNEQRRRSMIVMFQPRSAMKPAMLNILRAHAERNISRGDAVATLLVQRALLLLHYCSQQDGEGNQYQPLQHKGAQEKVKKEIVQPVLNNRWELDTMLREQDEDVSLGVIMHCVANTADNVAVASEAKEKKQTNLIANIPGGAPGSNGRVYLSKQMLESSLAAIEMGLSLIYFHVQYYMQELQLEQQLKRGNRLKAYQETVSKQVETHLAKVVTEASKVRTQTNR